MTTVTNPTSDIVSIATGAENVLRFTTDHRDHPINLKAPKHRTARHCDDFEIGDRLGRIMARHLGCPESIGRSIVTFTYITVMGKDAHDDNGAALRSNPDWKREGQQRWVKTQSRTYGFLPSAVRWQRRGSSEWAWSDCFAGADLLLGAFGLTVKDVLDHYGNVGRFERKVFDIPSILRAMRANMLLAA